MSACSRRLAPSGRCTRQATTAARCWHDLGRTGNGPRVCRRPEQPLVLRLYKTRRRAAAGPGGGPAAAAKRRFSANCQAVTVPIARGRTTGPTLLTCPADSTWSAIPSGRERSRLRCRRSRIERGRRRSGDVVTCCRARTRRDVPWRRRARGGRRRSSPAPPELVVATGGAQGARRAAAVRPGRGPRAAIREGVRRPTSSIRSTALWHDRQHDEAAVHDDHRVRFEQAARSNGRSDSATIRGSRRPG